MEKIAWDGPKWGPRGLFPANPDLADILGRTDLNFQNFQFVFFCIPNVWIFRSPILQISKFPGPQISKFPVSKFPDFQTPPPAPPPDELSDPNLTPLPTHPGIKYVARSPCCDTLDKLSDPKLPSPNAPLRSPGCNEAI